jgi:hypothetical protein
MKDRQFFAIEVLKRACMGLIVISAFSGLVMILWNFWVPEVLGLKAINIWQAAAMFATTRILFGHFWAGSHHEHHLRHHDFSRNNPLREKWLKMTDEERKDFFNKRNDFFRDVPFSREDFWKRKANRATPDNVAEGEQ